MDAVYTIFKDFGCVPCGVKTVETVKIENKTKKPQTLEVRQVPKKSESYCSKHVTSRLQIQPNIAVALPKQSVSFKLTYLSCVEDVTDNLFYNIFDAERLIAHLNIHAKSVGPRLHPTTFNLKFFRFREVNETVKHVDITNSTKNDAKYYFDVDEDFQLLEISQPRGVIPGGHKFGLKFTFNPSEPGVYYRKIFCIVQYHNPIIFNIVAVYKPKLKLRPKDLAFRYPAEVEYCNNYEAYFHKEETDRLPDPEKPLHKCIEDYDTGKLMNTEGPEMERKFWSLIPEPSIKPECKQLTGELFLTANFLNMKNSPEVPKATSLVNLSKCQVYYFQWDQDPKNNFQISPCKGFLKTNSKVDFTVYFTPSALDCIYHTEADLKIFIGSEEKTESSNTIDLPLTMSLRIIASKERKLGKTVPSANFSHLEASRQENTEASFSGHSFADNSCGWVPQCKIIPKNLYMRTCVPGDKVYSTFVIEREGHLPVTYSVVPGRNTNFTAHPPLAYLSRSFQLFVVEFNSNSKEPGIYTEDLTIIFNQSDANKEIVRLTISVEIPRLLFGKDNTVVFQPVFPGSKTSATVPIENSTNLDLCYEFMVPDEMDWIEIVNPKGSIEPKGFSEVTIIFKPKCPYEYSDYVPCKVSSVHKPDYYETIHLQVLGSCQFGYLVATPSIHDFGQCIYKKEKKIQTHLFNFSYNKLYFRLTVVSRSFPPGDTNTDVRITPTRGSVSAKGSVTVEIKITPNNTGWFEYVVQCQNFDSDSEEAEPCDDPRDIVYLKFEGVFPYIQIVDLEIAKGGPLFSSDMIWKMLEIDRINNALKSFKPHHEIIARAPEKMVRTSPININLLIESNKFGSTKWSVSTEMLCSCNDKSSFKNVYSSCWHAKPVSVEPSKFVTPALGKSLMAITIKYDAFDECSVNITFNLPNKKKLIVKMKLLCLPSKPPTCLSSYLSPTFTLRPVFIGDPQPPVQLFWLYNNTKYAASYFLDMKALQKAQQNVFDCINPEGVIQPFSRSPLGIIFSPTEMITYSVEIPLNLGRLTKLAIELTGEGALQPEPFKETAIKNSLPNTSIIASQHLRCCENFINIPFIGLNSEINRIFFLENDSKTESWFFQWSRCKFDNLFNLIIKPETGVIEPKKKVPMTLYMKTYNYPAFVNCFITCEILNYSQLIDYREWLRMQQMLEERDTQYFTITDKGTSHASTKMQKLEKPFSRFMFVTVNANIVTNLHMDIILDYKCQYTPSAGKEININKQPILQLSPKLLQPFQGLLEKILWDILHRHSLAEKIKHSQESQDFIYKQIMPESLKKKMEMAKFFEELPSKHLVQVALESTIHEVVSRNFIPHKSRKLNQDFQFQSNMFIGQDIIK